MTIRINTIWSLAGNGLPMLAGACLVPFILKHLGDEAFGVLTLVWALIGYFSLFDIGVGRTLTYNLSKLSPEKNLSKIAIVLKAGLLLAFLAGVVGAIVMLLLAPYLATSWLKISPIMQEDAKWSFYIAALGVIPTTLTSGVRGALEGLGYFSASNSNKILLGFCMFLLPAISIVIHGNHVWSITLYLVFARIVALIFALTQLRTYLKIYSTESILNYFKSLLDYGIWITLSGIVGPLMVYGDRFFVSASIGASLLPIYVIPQEILQRLLIIPTSMCAALLPAMASSSSKVFIGSYRKHFRFMTVLMFFICLIVAILLSHVLGLWINKSFAAQATPIGLIFVAGIWFNSMASVSYVGLHALGKTKVTAIIHIVELPLYLIGLFILTSSFGLVGAALAWSGRTLFDFVLLQYFLLKFSKDL